MIGTSHLFDMFYVFLLPSYCACRSWGSQVWNDLTQSTAKRPWKFPGRGRQTSLLAGQVGLCLRESMPQWFWKFWYCNEDCSHGPYTLLQNEQLTYFHNTLEIITCNPDSSPNNDERLGRNKWHGNIFKPVEKSLRPIIKSRITSAFNWILNRN